MPRQLVLHVGLYKTATTSIQRSCEANHQALAAAGFFYPRSWVKGQVESNHTAWLLTMFKAAATRDGVYRQGGLSEAELAQQRLRSREALATQLRQAGDRALMSAEGVSHFSPSELQDMREWFAAQGWDIRAICHVRKLGPWISSMVAQRVKGPMRLTIAQAVDEFAQSASVVRQRIENLRAALPGIEFHSHEQSLRHALGPVGYFLETVGVPQPQRLALQRANEGRSDNAIRVLSLINEKYGRFASAAERYPPFLRDTSVMKGLRRLPGPRFVLRKQEVAPVLALLQADNEWLRQALGPMFHDDELAFHDDACVWSEDGLAQLAAALTRLPPPARAWCQQRLAEPGFAQCPSGPDTNR